MNSKSFIVMSGSGNKFVIFDNRKNLIKDIYSSANFYCKKYKTDGVILLENSQIADLKMRIINPDGSEAETCGNGLRCASFFAYKNKILEKKIMKIETLAGITETKIITDNTVKVKLTKPKNLKLNIKLNNLTLHFINTGVPHAVIFPDNLEETDVLKLGRMIRYNKYFSPEGTNVNFVKVLDKYKIKIRTYERGVENETSACGTGAVASAIISAKLNFVKPPISVIPKSGEILKIYFTKELETVYLEGGVKILL